MGDEEYIDLEVDFVTSFFFERLTQILKWPSHKFYARCRLVGIDEEALQSFRARFIQEFADLEGDDDE
jgi:hypothetical protein